MNVNKVAFMVSFIFHTFFNGKGASEGKGGAKNVL